MAWAIDLDARAATAGRVRRRTAAAAGLLDGERRLMLKIDSAGRSPVGAMIDGASLVRRERTYLVSPAYPRQGARVAEGRLVLDDRRSGPVDLARSLGPNQHRVLALLEASVSLGPAALVDRLREAGKSGVTRVLVDATSDESLALIADAWFRIRDSVAVGSGGLARAIARRMGLEAVPGRPVARVRDRTDRIAIICGSPAGATARQLDALEAADPGVARVVVDARGRGRSIPPTASVLVFEGPRTRALARDQGQIGRLVATRAADALRTLRPRAIVVVGGATARSFLSRAHAERLDVLGEIRLGVPTGIVRGGALDGVPFVSKSGRFGDPRTLVDAVGILRGVTPP
jgi:uncharacterized protein YgbK (DUF1537 family)